MTSLEKLGTNIRKFRVSRKMSQAQLAVAMGMHHNFIQRMERGKQSPSIDTLIKLGRVLRCPVAALLDGVV